MYGVTLVDSSPVFSEAVHITELGSIYDQFRRRCRENRIRW